MPLLVYTLIAFFVLFLLSLTPPGANFRRWMMAKLYSSVQKPYEPYIAGRKKTLFTNLSGTVLEIGPGNGANFVHLPESVNRWIGIEPNPHMHAELRKAGEERSIEADFRQVGAEGMEVEDGSVDSVLSTLVLCSVRNPEAVLRDILRVLKPGGRFVFIEHVAAPSGSRLHRLQRLIKPIWWYIADGCCPDRELGKMIRNSGFTRVTLDEFTAPREAMPGFVSPQISGVAVK